MRLGPTLCWDFPALFRELKEGIRKAIAAGFKVKSIGVDTWGVDFGLIDRSGNLLALPVCYRDEATAPYPDRFFASHDAGEHYGVNGTQVMPINTLFRLLEIKDSRPWLLESAERLLFMPDLFNYFLCGVAANEYTMASTSELLDASKRTWDTPLIRECGLPERIFGNIVEPGTIIGQLSPEIMAETGATKPIDIVAVGSHDTASAVYAVEHMIGSDGAFLSCGTWSLLGALLDKPVLTETARLRGFTNEGGVAGKITFLQNITGLWILQRLVGQWQNAGMTADYPTLVDMARESGCTTVVDVDDPTFAAPGDMQGKITAYCADRGLEPPRTQGDFVMCVCRSLADRYRRGIEGMTAVMGKPVSRLVVVGGGAKNKLLMELTAKATGLEIVTGPSEATAIGNILMQAYAAGTDPATTDTSGC